MDRSVNDGLDYSGDAAVGSFFSSDYKRHDDLKQMLDSNRDNLKLEAMKRIIGMVAKGRDASELFPAVVKNVVSKNAEVKKLVYVYLVRYAEEQQDCALLSISTFQRALKDPNQLIRASALRVLSSIRVPMIVPIVMLAIRDASADMSPYVRKTAAHAIPKLYSLDPDQKEELVTVLDKLLADRTTLVVGSAVMAFEEVCPERIDLIHKNYRKLCALLMDVDEWGQVVILNMLTRYARTQFVDPNIGDLTIDGEERPFYEDEEHENGDKEEKEEDGESSSEGDNEGDQKKEKSRAGEKRESSKQKAVMDPDHRLLLKNARPLLQSRNSAVVMAVAQLYYHCAPKSEVNIVIKALIRLLRSHTEVQSVVLSCIAAMSTKRQSLFEPYMKSFYVRSSDPTQIKLLKLEILTNIANEMNIPPILREFQTYIASQDKEFVAAVLLAIGRCASNIKQVAETCLNGLVSLLSHRDPAVVGGAVVVAKTLLQSHRSGSKPVIAQLARMVDRVTVPPARAAILWLLGEHCERLPKLPPDVLRKMAKTFPDEDEIVKLQIINLAAKLQITNPSQTTLLCQYIFNLAKYDQSYDIRDRARFIRHLLFPENPDSKLTKYARKILFSSKPAPVLQSKFKGIADREHFQLGSLSHFLNTRALGYQDLPPFPEVAPDSSVRIVEVPVSSTFSDRESEFGFDATNDRKSKKKQSKKKSFYSDSEESQKSKSTGSSSSEDSSSSNSSSQSGSESEDSESDSSSGSETEGSLGSENSHKNKSSASSGKLKANSHGKKDSVGGKSNLNSKSRDHDTNRYKNDSESSTESHSDSSDDNNDSSSSSGLDKKKKIKVIGQKQSKTNKAKANVLPEVDLLFDMSDGTTASTTDNTSSANIMNNMSGEIMNLTLGSSQQKSDSAVKMQTASSMFIPIKKTELVNKIVSGGVQISCRFTRSPNLFSSAMASVELCIENLGKLNIKNIRVGQKTLASGISVNDFQPIDSLEAGKSVTTILGIDFQDTTQGAKIEILWETEVESKKQIVTINAPTGELVRPVTMSESLFITEQGKLRGMNEHEGKTFVNKTLASTTTTTARQSLVQRVYETANLLQVPSVEDHLVRFSGQSLSTQTLVLVTIILTEGSSESTDAAHDNLNPVSARILVNCEKIVIGSMLLQELKDALK